MTESPEELAAVEQLLAERDALHGWLVRLDQAPVAAPESVRARVRHDYQQRLDQLTAGLRAHADLIASKLDDDRREHDDLSGRARIAREALAEAELRHAVGEYDHDRYDGERVRYGSDIETYELSLSAVAERIARLEEVHDLVERAPLAPLVEPEPAPTEPQVHVIGEVDEDLVAIADLSPDADPEELLAIFEEGDQATDDGDRQDVPSPADTVGPLSFRPAGAAADSGSRPHPPSSSRPRPAEVAPPLGIPHAHETPRFVRPGERMRQASGALAPPAPPAAAHPLLSANEADAGADLFTEEIVATGHADDHVTAPVSRTLRCGECGAMNRPLEWYCEKCGAELTTV